MAKSVNQQIVDAVRNNSELSESTLSWIAGHSGLSLGIVRMRFAPVPRSAWAGLCVLSLGVLPVVVHNKLDWAGILTPGQAYKVVTGHGKRVMELTGKKGYKV